MAKRAMILNYAFPQTPAARNPFLVALHKLALGVAKCAVCAVLLLSVAAILALIGSWADSAHYLAGASVLMLALTVATFMVAFRLGAGTRSALATSALAALITCWAARAPWNNVLVVAMESTTVVAVWMASGVALLILQFASRAPRPHPMRCAVAFVLPALLVSVLIVLRVPETAVFSIARDSLTDVAKPIAESGDSHRSKWVGAYYFAQIYRDSEGSVVFVHAGDTEFMGVGLSYGSPSFPVRELRSLGDNWYAFWVCP